MHLKFVTCVTIQLAILISTTCHVLYDESQNNFPRNLTKDDYAEVLRLSLLFFEAQSSGELPKDNRIPWRGDSALSDRGENGEDLSGGFYDEGSSYVKSVFSLAFTTTMLAWGKISWGRGYSYADERDESMKIIDWASIYLTKCYVSKNVLYIQVGDFDAEFPFMGSPEEMEMFRPAFKIDEKHPGSDIAGETAAALAAVSILHRRYAPVLSDYFVEHAKELYDFANKYRGLYHVALGNVRKYKSSGYGDELAWAAAWLFKATRDPIYLKEATYHYEHFNLQYKPKYFSYDNKVAGVQVLLAEFHQGSIRREYENHVLQFCDHVMHKQLRTSKGLVYFDSLGTLSYAANAAFICLKMVHCKVEGLYSFAKEQINYMINGERSFVVGYGRNPPTQPYHIASSCPYTPCYKVARGGKVPNPHILYGALVSGPDMNDEFNDKWNYPEYTNVALVYNAGFSGVVAGLIHVELRMIALEKQERVRIRKIQFSTFP